MLSEISQSQEDKWHITHLNVESKIVKLMEAESGMLVASDRRKEEMENCCSAGLKFQLCKMNSSRDVQHCAYS